MYKQSIVLPYLNPCAISIFRTILIIFFLSQLHHIYIPIYPQKDPRRGDAGAQAPREETAELKHHTLQATHYRTLHNMTLHNINR